MLGSTGVGIGLGALLGWNVLAEDTESQAKDAVAGALALGFVGFLIGYKACGG